MTTMTTQTKSPLEVHCLGDTAIVRLHGDFGEFAVAEFDVLIRQTLHRFDEMQEVRNIVLNLEQSDYCGSSALGLFVSLAKRCRLRGGRLVLCHVSEHMREVLRVTELEQIWPIYGTLEEALTFVRQTACGEVG